MRIAVLVKQVPATDTVKIDETTGTMIREGVEAELNPLDLHAVEAALRIKESMPDGTVEITAVTMGPPQARGAAAYAIAMGCDRGALVSDKKFGGSDTLATSRTLTKALEALGPFDLYFAGERATDGETGQVGPAVAEFLGIPVLSYVSSIDTLENGRIHVTRAVEGGRERIGSAIPAMIIPLKEMNIPRLCTLGGKLRGKKAEIPILNAEDLGLDENSIGLKGSATLVINVTYPQMTRQGKKISAAGGVNEAAELILSFAEEKNCLEVTR